MSTTGKQITDEHAASNQMISEHLSSENTTTKQELQKQEQKAAMRVSTVSIVVNLSLIHI